MSLSLIVHNGLMIPYALLMIDDVLLCGLCGWSYGWLLMLHNAQYTSTCIWTNQTRKHVFCSIKGSAFDSQSDSGSLTKASPQTRIKTQIGDPFMDQNSWRWSTSMTMFCNQIGTDIKYTHSHRFGTPIFENCQLPVKDLYSSL